MTVVFRLMTTTTFLGQLRLTFQANAKKELAADEFDPRMDRTAADFLAEMTVRSVFTSHPSPPFMK